MPCAEGKKKIEAGSVNSLRWDYKHSQEDTLGAGDRCVRSSECTFQRRQLNVRWKMNEEGKKKLVVVVLTGYLEHHLK